MVLHIDAELRSVKGGMTARTSQLRLVGYGLDKHGAVEALQSSISAWCMGLRAIGALESALRGKNLEWEDGNEDNEDIVTIEIHESPTVQGREA